MTAVQNGPAHNTAAQADANAAASVLATIRGGGWAPAGLAAPGGIRSLDAEIRPIDGLTAAGLSWLKPMVQPLQGVVDRMAGNASGIQAFVDDWQEVATTVEALGTRLSQAARTETATWQGSAADAYRGRAAEIAAAAAGSATLAKTVSDAARMMADVLGGGRKAAGDLLTDLVRRLISQVTQAMAVEGGVTSGVVAQATSLINSYKGPIAAVESQVTTAISSVRPYLVSAGGGAADSVISGGSGREVLRGGGEPQWTMAAGLPKGLSKGRKTPGTPDSPKPAPGGGGDAESAFQRLKRWWSGDGKKETAPDTTTAPQDAPKQQQPLTPQQRHQVGYDREQAVAKMENGQVTSSEPGKIGKKIKTPFGSTDVDVIAGDGAYVAVGGPAKAADLGALGNRLRGLKHAADEAGVPARAYFEEGTSQSAIDLARKWLGPDNVRTFPPVTAR